MHSFRESFRLLRYLLLLVFREGRKLIIFRADEDGDRSLHAGKISASEAVRG